MLSRSQVIPLQNIWHPKELNAVAFLLEQGDMH